MAHLKKESLALNLYQRIQETGITDSFYSPQLQIQKCQERGHQNSVLKQDCGVSFSNDFQP
jgi:hypothetical protein